MATEPTAAGCWCRPTCHVHHRPRCLLLLLPGSTGRTAGRSRPERLFPSCALCPLLPPGCSVLARLWCVQLLPCLVYEGVQVGLLQRGGTAGASLRHELAVTELSWCEYSVGQAHPVRSKRCLCTVCMSSCCMLPRNTAWSCMSVRLKERVVHRQCCLQQPVVCELRCTVLGSSRPSKSESCAPMRCSPPTSQMRTAAQRACPLGLGAPGGPRVARPCSNPAQCRAWRVPASVKALSSWYGYSSYRLVFNMSGLTHPVHRLQHQAMLSTCASGARACACESAW